MTMSTIAPTVPQAVLDAALALHQRRTENLTFSPFNSPDLAVVENSLSWCCDGDALTFTKLEARNQCTALAIFQSMQPLTDSGALFDAAYKLWRNEIGHPDMASGRLLGLASQNLNVLIEAAQAIRNKQHATEVFQVLHLIEAALPHLSNVSADDVIAVVDAQYESTKGDRVVGLLFTALERRLTTESQLAWDIWRIARGNMSESMQSLYVTGLLALTHTDQQSLALEKAREDSDHINPLVACAALWALGRAIQVHSLNSSDADECVAILTSKVSTSTTEVRQTAIRAVAHAALKNARLMSELVQLAAEPSDYKLAVIADFLFMNHRDLSASSPDFKTLLNALIQLSPSQKDAIDKFDSVLHQLYETPENRPVVLDCLTQWIALHGSPHFNDKDSVELFDQTVMQIANDRSGLQTIITRWLVAPEKQLAVACGGLISYLYIRGMKSPTFSPEILNTFDLQDFKLLARRLLGYVIYEESLLSLTLSLLETDNAPARSFGWVYSLLTEEIGRDYAHATMEALKARQETAISPENELLGKIHAHLLQRSKALDDLPRLHEFRPPIRLRRAIALSRGREMEKAREVADEKSIIRSIATVIPMKAGRGWFSVSANQVGPTQHLQSISHSITMPKRTITDPVGYAIAGLHYRIAKRDDE